MNSQTFKEQLPFSITCIRHLQSIRIRSEIRTECVGLQCIFRRRISFLFRSLPSSIFCQPVTVISLYISLFSSCQPSRWRSSSNSSSSSHARSATSRSRAKCSTNCRRYTADLSQREREMQSIHHLPPNNRYVVIHHSISTTLQTKTIRIKYRSSAVSLTGVQDATVVFSPTCLFSRPLVWISSSSHPTPPHPERFVTRPRCSSVSRWQCCSTFIRVACAPRPSSAGYAHRCLDWSALHWRIASVGVCMCACTTMLIWSACADCMWCVYMRVCIW